MKTVVPDSASFAKSRIARLIGLLWLAVIGWAIGWTITWTSGTALAGDFLDVEDAFKLQVELTREGSLGFTWTIAPGYKLYRERLKFGAEGTQARLGPVRLPRGETAFDEALQRKLETYHDQLAVRIALAPAAEPFTLSLSYQGCAEAGFCYPPVDVRYRVDPAQPGILTALADPVASETASASSGAGRKVPVVLAAEPHEDEGSLAQQTLQDGSLWRIGLVFLIFGLLLSFTPCVLPMIPILSSIIVGEGTVTRRRGFMLALAYCLGMALVYTALGVAAGLAGAGMAAALQTPWVLGLFAALLLLLSLSMFDVYQLQMPVAIQSRLNDSSGRQRGGRLAGVFVMGALSALIVGPCVAAPLAGALLYISQTGDVWVGAWALFSMACGMSVPLMLTGVSAGSLLPRAGHWMNAVKRLFGLLLMATAIWMLVPVLSSTVLMVVVGAFAIFCAVNLNVFDSARQHKHLGPFSFRFAKALGLTFFLIGVFELVGAASGGNDVLQPLAHLRSSGIDATAAQTRPSTAFRRVTSVEELERELAASKAPVILDFYADWCVSCKEMEHFTFSDPKVREALGQFTLLQADVTANSAADRALMKKFSLFGPPALLIFDASGRELVQHRVIGFMPKEPFLVRLMGARG